MVFGILSEKYLEKFELEKRYYVTGETERGKKIPPIVEVIKSAIKRMDEQINQLNLVHTMSLDFINVAAMKSEFKDEFDFMKSFNQKE